MHKIKKEQFHKYEDVQFERLTKRKKKMVNDYPLLTNKEPNLQKLKIDFKDYSNADS